MCEGMDLGSCDCSCYCGNSGDCFSFDCCQGDTNCTVPNCCNSNSNNCFQGDCCGDHCDSHGNVFCGCGPSCCLDSCMNALRSIVLCFCCEIVDSSLGAIIGDCICCRGKKVKTREKQEPEFANPLSGDQTHPAAVTDQPSTIPHDNKETDA